MSISEVETTTAEVRAHRRSFIAFERLVLFATMHVALVLSCLALAFVGHVPVVAALLGISGTLVLITAFSIVSPRSPV